MSRLTRRFFLTLFEQKTPLITPLNDSLIPAAVFIPIIEHPHNFTVLFTERTKQMQKHSGQISFPGGAVEEHDENIIATALRETNEEIGLSDMKIEILGTFPSIISSTGYYVTPVCGLVKAPLELALHANEVASAFEVPLSFLLDDSNYQLNTYVFQNKTYEIAEITYEQHRIWGLTAMILAQFRELISLRLG